MIIGMRGKALAKGGGGMSCSVSLIASTPDASRVVAAAAKLCYSAVSCERILEGLDEAKTRVFLDRLRSSGHLSPFEHASFTFAIEGLSRVASHQLVRHRIASYSQQSQRYVQMDDTTDCVMPRSVAENPEARRVFADQVRAARNAYETLVEMGVDREDARFILPHGWQTRLIMTMNARELHHFFAVRTCRRAQWEIREAALVMLTLAHREAPDLFSVVGPACVTRGKCEESHPCGKPYAGVEELLLR